MSRVLIALAIILLTGVMMVSASKFIPDNSPEERQRGCKASWGQSGYPYRVMLSDKRLDGKFHSYECQVYVNGRWFPASNVKVGK